MDKRWLRLLSAAAAGAALTAILRKAAGASEEKNNPVKKQSVPPSGGTRPIKQEEEMVPVRLSREHYIQGRLCREPITRTMCFLSTLRLSEALTLLNVFLPEGDDRPWTVFRGGRTVARLDKTEDNSWRCKLMIPDMSMAELRDETLFFCHLSENG